MRWGWLIGAALLGVAALSIYSAFQSPEFVWGLVGAMAISAYNGIAPVLQKRMSPEHEAAWRKAIRQGRDDEFRRKRRGAPPKG